MRRALACREFRLLWLGQSLSALGDHIVLVVLALYVNDIGSPSDVGVVLASNALPFVALLLLGGVWADRLPRQRVMVATDVIRGVLHVGLALLILEGDVPIWAIAGIEACFGAAQAFFQPAYTGLLPQSIPEDLMQEAQALTSLTQNASGFLGPAIGSTLFVTGGAASAFMVDASTFMVGAGLLLQMRPIASASSSQERESLRSELVGGWRELRSRPWALLVILYFSIFLMIAMAPFSALGPAIADRGYGEAAFYGVISAVIGAGAIAGSLLAARWRPDRPLLLPVLGMGVMGVGHIAFAGGLVEWAVLPLYFAGGVGFSVCLVVWDTTLAREIPPAALSRVSSYDWMGSVGLLPFGYLLAGPVGEEFGVRETLSTGSGIAIAVALLIAWARPVRAFQASKSGTPYSGVEASA